MQYFRQVPSQCRYEKRRRRKEASILILIACTRSLRLILRKLVSLSPLVDATDEKKS